MFQFQQREKFFRDFKNIYGGSRRDCKVYQGGRDRNWRIRQLGNKHCDNSGAYTDHGDWYNKWHARSGHHIDRRYIVAGTRSYCNLLVVLMRYGCRRDICEHSRGNG